MRGNNYAREPSSAFREVLQTQLRSPVETRGDTHETALVIFPVQRVRASSLRVRVIASNAFLLRALLRASCLVPGTFMSPSWETAIRSFALIINVPDRLRRLVFTNRAV